jgi:hypothetical protein
MHVFGEIDRTSNVVEQNIVNYTHNFTTSSLGIQSTKIVSGSTLLSGSYWDSLNVLFYSSGSEVYTDASESKFGRPSSNLSLKTRIGTQYLHKFHGYPSSSIIEIPQQYYGEKIKEKSFTFTTNFKVQLDSSNTITTYEYNVTVKPSYYNHSTNYSLRNALSGSDFSLATPYYATTFTSSDFQPYITTINLFSKGDYDTPVIQATLPRAIRKSNLISTAFKIRLDI